MAVGFKRALLRQLLNNPSWRVAARHIECGVHSGLPPCCIGFYVTIWWPARAAEEPWCAEYTAHSQALGDPRPGYVLCPRCMAEALLRIGSGRPARYAAVLACGCALPQDVKKLGDLLSQATVTVGG